MSGMAAEQGSLDRSPRVWGVSCWSIPIIAGFTWLLTLLSLIISWPAQTSLRDATSFPSLTTTTTTAGEIPSISDVGGSPWGQAIIIAGSGSTVLIFGLVCTLERQLRHRGFLLHWCSPKATVLSGVTTAFALLSACGLLLLAALDVRRFPDVHRPMAAVFISSYIVSASSMCAEKRLLSDRFPRVPLLRLSYQVKLWFVITSTILISIFGFTLSQTGGSPAFSIITEWIVAFLLTFYIWSFALDFLCVPVEEDMPMKGFEEDDLEDDVLEEKKEAVVTERELHIDEDGEMSRCDWDAESVISKPEVRVHVNLQQFLGTLEKSKKRSQK